MKTRTAYVNRAGNGYRETVDEFPYTTRAEQAEARRMAAEYSTSDPAGTYRISSRPCAGWRTQAPTTHPANVILGTLPTT